MAASEDGQNQEFIISYNANKKPSQASSGENAIKFNYAGNLLDKTEIYTKEGGVETMGSYIKYNYSDFQVSEAVSYLPH
ncbi:hypothetical protein [Mucilaginibacter lacusdianchii]|uniref:hypothetical protein n=1 Tax=Mucilaginibacter lacusdianchii TaxID=2684211 RepID=UPI00131BFCB2|nr:hypothetical protein [Mucilaginibacter sp. JXJ CY 39]